MPPETSLEELQKTPVAAARERVEQQVRELGWRGDIDAVSLALHEALMNAERHGGGLRDVHVTGGQTQVHVEVLDHGQPFEAAPYIAHPPDPLAERGRGLWLVHQLADEVRLRSDPLGNSVAMVFGSRARDRWAESAADEERVTARSLRSVDLMNCLGAAALLVDDELLVVEAAGAFDQLFGLRAEALVGRDARGVASEMKPLFSDAAAFENRVLAEYAHWDATSDEIVLLSDGRLIRRRSMVHEPGEGGRARLVMYLPVPEQTDLVAGIQRALLPAAPAWEAVSIGAIYHPAEATAFVGGDFYDFTELSSGARCVLIGDVSGRGPAAAATSTIVRAYMRAALMSHGLTGAISALEETLRREFTPEEFVTLTLCVQEAPTIWTLTNCGHPPSLLFRDGTVTQLSARGPLLGMGVPGQWVREPIVMRPGDTLLLFTDGVIEAGSRDRRFGTERLQQVFGELVGMPAQDLVEAIDQRVHDFALGDIDDDHVLVAVSLP